MEFILNSFFKFGKKPPKQSSERLGELLVRRVRGVGVSPAAEMWPLDEPASAAFVDLRLKYLFKPLIGKTSQRKTSSYWDELLGFFCPKDNDGIKQEISVFENVT